MVVGQYSLNGKVVVVTGGGSGIGLSFVRLALDSGAKVLLPDLKLTTEAAELIKSSNGNAAYTQCDVSKWKDLERIPSEVENAFGKGAVGDVWVPSAGIFEPKWSSFLYDTEDEFYMQMRVNAEHPLKLTRIAMRSLLGANKPGVVCLISSGAGLTGIYSAALYCATKHAVVGFTKCMGQADADEGIKIVCVCPGMVSTPLWKGEQGSHHRGQYGYKDDMCVTPEEVAQGMKELVEESKYPGGTIMEVKQGALRKLVETAQATIDEGMDQQGPEIEAYLNTLYKPVREEFAKERGGAARTNGA